MERQAPSPERALLKAAPVNPQPHRIQSQKGQSCAARIVFVAATMVLSINLVNNLFIPSKYKFKINKPTRLKAQLKFCLESNSVVL